MRVANAASPSERPGNSDKGGSDAALFHLANFLLVSPKNVPIFLKAGIERAEV
jgi:hypothetical protein